MRLKRLFTVIGIIAVLVVGLIAYIGLSFRGLSGGPHSAAVSPNTQIAAFLLSKSVLSYDSNNYLIPYVQLRYVSSNVTALYVNSTLFVAPPPTRIYILNVTNACYNCGQLKQTTALIAQDLQQYGVVANSLDVSVISEQNVSSIPNDSALVILSGAMPIAMFSPVQNSSETLIERLLDKGTDIIYVGRNFSNATSGQVLVPVPQGIIPKFLSWSIDKNYTANAQSGFYFGKPAFYLTNGTRYGPLSYIYHSNGSILVFPDYLTSWNGSTAAAQDISKALSQLFWVQKYSYGSAALSPKNLTNATGIVGFPLIHLSAGYNYRPSTGMPYGYGRIVIYNNPGYALSQGSAYSYIPYKLNLSVNGTVSMPESVVPAVQVPVAISIFTHSSVPVSVSPHINIYNVNLTEVTSIPLAPFNTSGNFTFIKPLTLYLPPGQYIAEVQGFYDNIYGSALFNITPVIITLLTANYTSDSFVFSVTSGGTPLSGVDYQISVNGLYPSSGTIEYGALTYSLPSGASAPKGNVKFNIYMLSDNFTYIVNNQPLALKINSQYIELAIVIIVALVLITVIRAPNRDEFYIDVPSMREEQRIPIKIKAVELVSAFDKLNIYNHWRFMPLSVDEVRHAVASNIRYNNIQVSLTHSNAEMMLDQMVSAGLLVSADGLYAPKGWVAQSGHDIEYLATFKKLRVYMVSHAYQASDIDTSDKADMVTSIHDERSYIVIYSKTSKFQKVRVFGNAKSYIAFLNAGRLDEFNRYLHGSPGADAEEIRMYISSGSIGLMDADNPEGVLT